LIQRLMKWLKKIQNDRFSGIAKEENEEIII